MYDEERRLSDGSDSCWSDAGRDSDSEAELEVGSRSSALEGAVVVAAQEGELVESGLGPQQPDGKAPAVLGKRVQREEDPLHPGGVAPKRMIGLITGQDGRGKQQQRKGGRGRVGAEQKNQGNGKWSMPGFSVNPGSAVQVSGNTAGRETWLGVDLLRGGGGGKVTGWMQSRELQERTTGDAKWLARLRGKGREGWSVEDHSWVCSEGPAVTGHGLRGAVVGWYLSVLVLDERQLKKVGGVRVVVLMRRVAVGRTAGGVEQAVGIRCRQEWHRHKMSREQLVGITGQRVQADGGREILMEGQEVWEEWTGQAVEDTEWRKEIKA